MNEKPPARFSVISRIRSFRHAIDGIAFSLRTQHNARIHLFATVAICVTGLWLDVRREDWRWLIACMALVWFSELMNTAFEYVCDVLAPDPHASVKRAKDIAAGAVLTCAMAAAAIGVLTFLPYL